jgi:hypothetical protein
MPALGEDCAFLTQYIRNLRGGSQPILAQASDGHTYVVKFANNLQGPNLLFNESAGTELYRACGLPVPEWKPLVVSDAFLDRNPDCWIQTPEGRLRPASGLCFGSRFLGGLGKRLLEILPGSSFKRVRTPANFWLAWLIDICAEHGDNRQALFTEDAEGLLDTHFVDFGHFFGGPKADLKMKFCASRYLDARIYVEVSSETLVVQDVLAALDADSLWARIEAIPNDWKQMSAISVFERCIQRLKNPTLRQNVLETITYDIKRRAEIDSRNSANEQCGQREVLRPGIQAPDIGIGFADNPACA